MKQRGVGFAILTLVAIPTFGQGATAPRFPGSEGAAPGYVNDRACGLCHRKVYRTYQRVGMARSFFRPRADRMIEDFDSNRYFHGPSKRHYEMHRRGEDLVFKRYQLDADGDPINVFEHRVDYVLGSGNHSRTYLYRTPGDELFQLPLAWYVESGWGMAPGFERGDHEGVARQVRRECMFCHNAYPEVPVESDTRFAPHVFPPQLPEGTGCQRCHGPAAEHVRLAFDEESDSEAVLAAIKNPGRMDPARRDDVCYSCHLQSAVALFGVRRFGRGDYSWLPGEPLADYILMVDVEEEGKERSKRFEINHHAYRLRQSRCFTESRREGSSGMSCLTCHDPHRKVLEGERAAHYRKACLSCHDVEACRLDEMAASVPGSGNVAADDCVTCHMAKRRPQDVVHVVMTDHLIRRRPGGPELVAPRVKGPDPVLVDIDFLLPETAPTGKLGELYKAVAVTRSGGNPSSLTHLDKMLRALRPQAVEPYLDLARGLTTHGQVVAAEKTLRSVLGRHPDETQAWEWLALLRYRSGAPHEASTLLQKVVDADPRRVEARFNLALILAASGSFDAAAEHLEKTLALRPVMAPAWYYRGRVQARLGHRDEAVKSFEEALRIDPGHEEAYLEIGRVLRTQGEEEAARRWWRHGAQVARKPGVLVEALEER